MKLPWIAIAVIGWVIVALYSAIPTVYWYELQSVQMTDEYQDEEVEGSRIIEVDRTINAAFQGWYRVEEHLLVNEQWLAVAACENTRAVNYRLDAELQIPTTVEWWAWGDCDVLPPISVVSSDTQTYRMCTWVEIEILPLVSFLRKSIEPVCTQNYVGRAIPRN